MCDMNLILVIKSDEELNALKDAINVAYAVADDTITDPLNRKTTGLTNAEVQEAILQIDENVNRLVALVRLQNRVNQLSFE